jgi:putative ABC transport system permease protein
MENSSPFVEWSLTLDDARRIMKEPWAEAVSGQAFEGNQISARGVTRNISIIGALPDEVVVNDYGLADGVFFSMAELDGHARVAVLGSEIAEDIFGQERAVGKIVKVGDSPFRVIGVLDKIGSQFMMNIDELVFLPASAFTDLTRNKYFDYFMVKTALPLDQAQRRLEELLRDLHDIDNPENDPAKDDYFIMTQAEAVKTIDQITGALRILLIAIAAISLVVGGIGIMNIMFVSVTERISEIGLRKAVGARRRDVLAQFLAEAVVLTLGGGSVGIILGSALAWLAINIINGYLPGWEFMISWRGALVGATVSTLIGLIFGYLPARRAARLQPIEAMRAE